MTEKTSKILLVEPEAELVEILVASLSRRFDAHITCVSDAESCLDAAMLDSHHVVVSELDLGNDGGLQLAEKLTLLGTGPIILLGDDPTVAEAITALRLGVRDLLIKPFAVAELLDAVERSLRSYNTRQARLAKYHRMRKVFRQVLRERKELNRRVELVCQDLVGAHRRLVDRVLAGGGARSAGHA